MAHRQRACRAEAEALLFDRLPGPLHRPVRTLLDLAAGYVPLRESGRAAVLRTVDVARAAASIVGEACARDGRMLELDDVFMLTVPELCGEERAPGAEELAFRRERWEAYERIDVPAVWQGVPMPEAAEATHTGDPAAIEGIGVSAGIAEGPVHVVHDAAEQIAPGEVLVCHTTDPSWASLFLLASAVVIDIGGPISHGAIVARELGIPCVINTGNGTRGLRTGERVRVDGSLGTVERVPA